MKNVENTNTLNIYKAKTKYRVSCLNDVYDENSLKANEKAIMLDIYLNGPVTSIIALKDDLYQYKGGIYGINTPINDLTHTNTMDKYHSVIISGYGELDGKKYWIVSQVLYL